ncbi:MAG: murein hydrolase activator EnvC family protein [Sphingorhabdus sp.]
MRFWSILLLLAFTPFAVASGLMAQSLGSSSNEQEALRDAKEKALIAERRSELLRQEASNAESTADRLVAQRAVLSAEIDAAEAQIEAATARIAIIGRRQQFQRAQLGVQSEPVLRLNAALQQMTGRPTVLMMMQPGQREDYVHLRAVMATVQPQIIRRTSALRQQMAVQSELRAQELLALKSLGDARSRLKSRQTALASLEGDARGNAGELSANAAIAFEQAIAQGERARDIVGRIDTQRLSAEKASELAALDGPMLRPGRANAAATGTAYMLPAHGKLLSGFNELNTTGYRERGVRIALADNLRVVAPAAGTISFAGRYRSYGQIVIIEHGNGWNSLITNLGSTQVKKGQAVTQGAALGSAKADAPEIGIELRKNGRVMDIATILG